MTWLKDKLACDASDCDEVFRGPTFPSSEAAQTWEKAFAAGWRELSPYTALITEHLCPACYRRLHPALAARDAREQEQMQGVREAIELERAQRLASVKISVEDGRVHVKFPRAPSRKVLDFIRSHFTFSQGAWSAPATQANETIAHMAADLFAKSHN